MKVGTCVWFKVGDYWCITRVTSISDDGKTIGLIPRCDCPTFSSGKRGAHPRYSQKKMRLIIDKHFKERGGILGGLAPYPF